MACTIRNSLNSLINTSAGKTQLRCNSAIFTGQCNLARFITNVTLFKLLLQVWREKTHRSGGHLYTSVRIQERKNGEFHFPLGILNRVRNLHSKNVKRKNEFVNISTKGNFCLTLSSIFIHEYRLNFDGKKFSHWPKTI